MEAMEEGVVPEKASRDCKFERFCTEEGRKPDRMTAASGQNPRWALAAKRLWRENGLRRSAKPFEFAS